MNTIKNKPFNAIWFSIPFILGLSFLRPFGIIDFGIHDTYYVISIFHLGILFSLVLGLSGMLYWLVRGIRLIDWMTVWHVVFTITAFLVILFAGLKSDLAIPLHFNNNSIINQFIIVIILLMISAQLIFLLNLILSIIINKAR